MHYTPRLWARNLHASWLRWFAIVIHRRAGKTTSILNHHIRAATRDQWVKDYLLHQDPTFNERQLEELCRYRVYAHILPQLKQAKLTSWDMLKYYASAVPGHRVNESELRIDFPGHKGQTRRVQLFGADHLDGLRGVALSGLSLDEFGQHPPTGFGDILSKALADHLGYCIWSGTIKGKNQLYQMWDAGRKDPEKWFTLWQDVDVTLQTERGATIKTIQRAMADDLDLVAKGIMTLEEYDQEWHLSHEAAIVGAYYAKQMRALLKQNRITRVPFDPALPVDTDWDLGMDDYMSIWFSQSAPSGEVRLIDYYQNSGEGLAFYIQELRTRAADRGYVYGQHWAPHDIEVRELGTGESRRETAAKLGLKFHVAPKLDIADGIDAVRRLLPRCWFDEERTAQGLECLRQYRKTWNEKHGQFTSTPVHDWACVTGDTLVLTRYGAYQIQLLPSTGEVLTPCGWKPYHSPKLTRSHAPLVEVTFEDGFSVRCTPDHGFLTLENGWRFASDLETGSLIQSCWTPLLNTLTGDSIASGPKSAITPGAGSDCISPSGPERSGLFRPGAISIIETVIRRITGWRIWSVFPKVSTWRRVGETAPNNTLSISRLLLVRRPQSGTVQSLGDSGIDAMRSGLRAGRDGDGSPVRVTTAGKSNSCWFGDPAMPRNTALSHARPLRIASVRRLDERADVWCLTVPDGHMWPLANGAMVHNSHGSDAFRGLATRKKSTAIDVKKPPRPTFAGTPSNHGWMS